MEKATYFSCFVLNLFITYWCRGKIWLVARESNILRVIKLVPVTVSTSRRQKQIRGGSAEVGGLGTVFVGLGGAFSPFNGSVADVSREPSFLWTYVRYRTRSIRTWV
jgi:hypothetical protein